MSGGVRSRRSPTDNWRVVPLTPLVERPLVVLAPNSGPGRASTVRIISCRSSSSSRLLALGDGEPCLLPAELMPESMEALSGLAPPGAPPPAVAGHLAGGSVSGVATTRLDTVAYMGPSIAPTLLALLLMSVMPDGKIINDGLISHLGMSRIFHGQSI